MPTNRQIDGVRLFGGCRQTACALHDGKWVHEGESSFRLWSNSANLACVLGVYRRTGDPLVTVVLVRIRSLMPRESEDILTARFAGSSPEECAELGKRWAEEQIEWLWQNRDAWGCRS